MLRREAEIIWLFDARATLEAASVGGLLQLIADETEKWGNVIRVANIKPD